VSSKWRGGELKKKNCSKNSSHQKTGNRRSSQYKLRGAFSQRGDTEGNHWDGAKWFQERIFEKEKPGTPKAGAGGGSNFAHKKIHLNAGDLIENGGDTTGGKRGAARGFGHVGGGTLDKDAREKK